MQASRTAFVTGIDDSFIARAICSSLLKDGYKVIVATEGNYLPGTKERKEFDDENMERETADFRAVDYSDKESIDRLIVGMSGETIDVIVNCAATLALKQDGTLRNEAYDFDYSEFDRVMRYNVTNVAAICFGLEEQLAKNAVIANVTSSAAQEGAFATISYNASKAAVDNLTKTLANVLGPKKGVRVNSIAPGWIPPNPNVAAGGIVALANSLTPSYQIGLPEHVVATLRYLIANPFQNGAIIPVDGGITSSYLPYFLETLELNGEPIADTIEKLSSLLQDAKQKMKNSE